LKINKNYVIGFIVDYGPPTLLSVIWALYVVYQQPDDPFWTVFAKNFVPAFFVLNWLAMRFHRTKKTVDNKERNKKLFEKIEEIDEKITRIEKQLENKK
tara:strand:- start:7 stop:303 length:297 start_codon:yes stop_codon:yes gene_type:complete